MAHWTFRQVRLSPKADRSSKWAWELKRDDGRLMARSEAQFTDFRLCTEDAVRHGYYCGHPRVTIRPLGVPEALV